MADDFGLNIVCEAPIVANRNGVIKKNKKNKYEKRRDRSRRAKSQGDPESISSRHSRGSNVARPVPVDTNTDTPLLHEDPNPPSNHQQEVHESEEQESSDEATRKSENEALSIMPDNKVSSSATPA